jgi:glycosyltransferase involved in cell wall biosynthesis
MGERRVLLLLGPSTGGIRRHVASLRDGLTARGWHVEVAGPAGVMDTLCELHHEVAVGLDPRSILSGRRRVRRLASSVDLVHAHGLKAGWLASIAGTGRPTVVTLHNVVLDESAGRAAPLLRRFERWLPGRVDRVIAVSRELATRVAPAAIVIPPVAPWPAPARARGEVRAALGVAPTGRLVVCVARLHPQKDIPTLLAAAVGLDGDVRVAVVGDGPDRAELEAARDALGLGRVVVFTGASANAADELAAADVVVLPSRWEGSPLVVAEALLLGRPVIATAVGAVPEVVVDGVTGRLVSPGDAAGLRRAVADVLAHPDDAARMAAAGQVAARERFAPDALVDRVVDVYEGVLGAA